jgi:hypothetical protein
MIYQLGIFASCFGEYPLQKSTGSRGYFGKLGLVAESWHMMKTAPRSERIERALRQSEHRPACTLFGESLTEQA